MFRPAGVAALLLVAWAGQAQAGGGPETTVVVVNADSPVSRRVANEYARLRRIPASHLIDVPGVPSLGIVPLETFRTHLWGPVKQALVERGLLESTDLLAWSADFPFAVDVAAEAKASKCEEYPHVPFRASLTSLTYLWRRVEAGDARGYLDLSANRYFRRDRAAGGGGGALDETQRAVAHEAETALQKKDYAGARDAYRRLLEAVPGLPFAWYNLACCQALLGEADAALDALTHAVEKGWSNAHATDADADLKSLHGRKEYDELLARMRASVAVVRASAGFRSAIPWTSAGEPAADAAPSSPDRYLLSVMLGYTGPFGNSAEEVLACLERAAAADGTNPKGTVYLLANDDVRANTRELFFDGTLAALTGMGRRAAVLTKGHDGQDGVVPKGKDDVIGAVLGTAGFAWKDSGSRMLPGAIAEHLTSHGADFSHGGQTKIAELLRHGAAGSSGTVAEPLALWQKFPVPSLHVHYAAGCSLAEAFYQSLAGPWQTLVVGDPLARPFAGFARVTMAAPAAAEPLRGTVEVRVLVEPAAGTRVGSLELWVDGLRRTVGPADQPLAWDTTKEDDGLHEVRVVAIEASPIETRSFAVASLVVANADRSVTLVAAKGPVPLDGELALSGKAGDALEVEVLCGARVLAKAPVKSGGFRATVPAQALGLASPPLVARARFKEGPLARSAHLTIDVEPRGGAKAPPTKPSKPVKPSKPGREKTPPTPAPPGTAGLALTVVDAKGKRHEGSLTALSDAALKQALETLKVEGARSIELEGEIEVAEEGLYELVLQSSGPVAGRFGAVEFHAPDSSPTRAAFAMAPLTAGWNPIRLVLDPLPTGTPMLSALLSGARVAAPLPSTALRQSR